MSGGRADPCHPYLRWWLLWQKLCCLISINRSASLQFHSDNDPNELLLNLSHRLSPSIIFSTRPPAHNKICRLSVQPSSILHHQPSKRHLKCNYNFCHHDPPIIAGIDLPEETCLTEFPHIASKKKKNHIGVFIDLCDFFSFFLNIVFYCPQPLLLFVIIYASFIFYFFLINLFLILSFYVFLLLLSLSKATIKCWKCHNIVTLAVCCVE